MSPFPRVKRELQSDCIARGTPLDSVFFGLSEKRYDKAGGAEERGPPSSAIDRWLAEICRWHEGSHRRVMEKRALWPH